MYEGEKIRLGLLIRFRVRLSIGLYSRGMLLGIGSNGYTGLGSNWVKIRLGNECWV